MPTIFKTRPQRKHLLQNTDGSLPLAALRISEEEKIAYCWRVLTSGEDKFTRSYKDGAIAFLKGSLPIPEWINKDNLSLYTNGARPDATAFSLEKQLAFAWLAYESNEKAYNKEKKTAQRLLQAHYGIPAALSATQTKDILLQLSTQRTLSFSQLPMPKLDTIETFEGNNEDMIRFIDVVNRKITALNAQIDTYNITPTVENLQSVYQSFDTFEHEFSGEQIIDCKPYQEIIHHRLFSNLKTEAAKRGITLSSLATPSANTPERLQQHPLNSILVEMSPNKTSRFLKKLLQACDGLDSQDEIEPPDLDDVYQAHEEGYGAFRRFLENYNIQFLGGGNSKNFKVTGRDGESIVLKIDNRLGQPKAMEQRLKQTESLAHMFTATTAERHTLSNGEYRTLLLSEYVTGNDLMAHAKKQQSDNQKIESAISIYTQMIDALINIEAAGAMHPDMKNTNWLIDEKGMLKVADTKAFLPIHEGKVDKTSYNQQWYGILYTPNYKPPKLGDEGSEANKTHAYILGKNLYQYLTNCETTQFSGHEGYRFDFNDSVFKTEQGAQLKDLIQSLVQKNPHDRIDLNRAKHALEELTTPDYRACRDLLEEIRATQLGENDPKMLQFYTEKQALINNTSKDEIGSLKTELEAIRNKLDSRQFVELDSIIRTLRADARFYTVGMRAKADAIENALKNVPVEERGAISESGSPAAQAVLHALARHRHLHKKDLYLNDQGQLDETKAAASFHKFKNAIRTVRNDTAATQSPVEPESEATVTPKR